MGSSAQLLPPKMAALFAERAKRGEADESTGSIYIFYQGRQQICLVSLDPPQGHVSRLSASEFQIIEAKRKIKKGL